MVIITKNFLIFLEKGAPQLLPFIIAYAQWVFTWVIAPIYNTQLQYLNFLQFFLTSTNSVPIIMGSFTIFTINVSPSFGKLLFLYP